MPELREVYVLYKPLTVSVPVLGPLLDDDAVADGPDAAGPSVEASLTTKSGANFE